MADAATTSGKLFPNLHGTADQGAPVADEQGAGKAPIESTKNVFTELFGHDVSQLDSGLMNSVAQKSNPRTNFFKSKPKAAGGELTLKSLRSVQAKPGASLLKGTFLLGVAVVLAFLSQNSSAFSFFGVNPALRVEQNQADVLELTAQVEVEKHLTAVLLLDQYSSLADEYFYSLEQAESEYSSSNKREEYEKKGEELRPELVALLGQIQNQFNMPLSDVGLTAARMELDELITELHAKKGTVDEQTLLQDIQDLQSVQTLLQSQAFKDSVTSLIPAEVTGEQLQSMANDYESINASVTAIIRNIQNAQKTWSFYLEEIESLTESIYPLFNTEFQVNLNVEDVLLNTDGSVVVRGRTVTDDTKNFTLVSDLIDAYNESEYFMNAQDRNFNKNDAEKNYTGSFNITMNIEQ